MNVFLAWKNEVQVTWAKLLFCLCGLVGYSAWVKAQPFEKLCGLGTQCLSHIPAWHPHDWSFLKSVLQTWFKDNYCKYFLHWRSCIDSWRVNDSVLLIWLQLNWQTFLRSHLCSMAIIFEVLRGYHEHGKHPTNGLFLQERWMQIESPLSTAEFPDSSRAPCLGCISFAYL